MRTHRRPDVEWVEQHGVRAAVPRALESYSHSTVGMLFEALKGEWRASNVTARDSSDNALEALAVATVHGDGGADVDAADFSQGRSPLVRPLHEAERTNELGGLAARAGTEQLNIASVKSPPGSQVSRASSRSFTLTSLQRGNARASSGVPSDKR